MKKLRYPALILLAMVLLAATGCRNRGSVDKSVDPESVITVSTGDEGEEVSGVPAVVLGESAGCYNLEDDGSMTYVMSLERFTEILYLKESGEFTYVYQEKERSGEFLKCLVDRDGERIPLWILDFNVKPGVTIGVVLNTCLLYSKDRLDKITDKEVTAGTLVLKDIVWKADKFDKITVPELGDKEYYILTGDFSAEASDVQVAMIYRAAQTLGEGKEKQKRQLLQNAMDSFPASPLITLIYEELNLMDGSTAGEEPMANNGPSEGDY